jgi:hypothetical protein
VSDSIRDLRRLVSPLLGPVRAARAIRETDEQLGRERVRAGSIVRKEVREPRIRIERTGEGEGEGDQFLGKLIGGLDDMLGEGELAVPGQVDRRPGRRPLARAKASCTS